jgi:hypothetical protein
VDGRRTPRATDGPSIPRLGVRRAIVPFMARKPASKPKLTDAERHKRFVEMAREVEASESPKAFDRAFKRVARVKAARAQRSKERE